MSKWDDHTAPTLRVIAELAIQIEMRAKFLESALRDLPAKPDFITRAQDELSAADAQLSKALRLVRQATAQYDQLPVMDLVGE